MNDQNLDSGVSVQAVVDRLRELADATKHQEPSPEIEARLMQAFAGAHPAQTPHVMARVRRVPAIAACTLLATAVTLLVFQARRPKVPPGDAAAASAAGVLDGFVPVPGVTALPQLESGRIVRYQLPVTSLQAYGIDVVPDSARRAVEADLLIGQDGYPRAIRLVSGRSTIRSTP